MGHACCQRSERKNRLRMAKELLTNTKCDERRLFGILTGDETWICYEEPKKKYQSAEWRAEGEPPPQKTKPDIHPRRVLFVLPKARQSMGHSMRMFV